MNAENVPINNLEQPLEIEKYQKYNYFPRIPAIYKIREYQQEAIKNWFRNDCQGLLEMATGTGKTITALSAVAKLAEVTERLAVIIVCPYIHLVDQWTKDIKNFNMSPVVAYRSKKLWEDQLYNFITAFQSKVIDHFCLITTNSTFTSKNMQDFLKRISGDAVIVVDEAHHLGATKNRKALLENISYGLALSATPNRWFDEEGTKKLIQYFGNKVVYEFGLKKAIGEFLTNYFYYPHH